MGPLKPGAASRFIIGEAYGVVPLGIAIRGATQIVDSRERPNPINNAITRQLFAGTEVTSARTALDGMLTTHEGTLLPASRATDNSGDDVAEDGELGKGRDLPFANRETLMVHFTGAATAAR
jgi:hypothetical protein